MDGGHLSGDVDSTSPWRPVQQAHRDRAGLPEEPVGKCSAESSCRGLGDTEGLHESALSRNAAYAQADMLIKRLEELMQQQKQQDAVAAAFSAAAESLPLVQEKLVERRMRPAALVSLRHPIEKVTLVAETTHTATSQITTENTEAENVSKVQVQAQGVNEVSGSSSSDMSNRRTDLMLLDISLQDKESEDHVFCCFPELVPLLRRGLSVLEFIEKPEHAQQETNPPDQGSRQQHMKHNYQQQSKYVLVRRGLPKFFDLDLELLACFILQETRRQKQQHESKQRQKEQRTHFEQPPHVQELQKDRQQQQNLPGQEQNLPQQPQGGKPLRQRRTPECHQKQRQRGQARSGDAQSLGESAVNSALDIARRGSAKALLCAHQLSACLLRSLSISRKDGIACSSDENTTNAVSLEVWALEKLNGEAAQISFCSELNAWACCSKNVCVFLPAAAAAANGCRYTLPSAGEAIAATTETASARLQQQCSKQHQQREEGHNDVQQRQEEQQRSCEEQQEKQQDVVALLRLLGADRIFSQPFSVDTPRLRRRETYALRVSDAWQKQLQRLTQEQVRTLQQLLQKHTLVGELIGDAEKQHIVPASKQRREQQRQQCTITAEGRLIFFALVPHNLEGTNGGFGEPPCLCPSVSLPLLQSLGLETASLAARLQASSPLELLLPLCQLELQRASDCDTEGLVLYFCSRTAGVSGADSKEASTVVALAKVKSAPYLMRRKTREKLKRLVRSRCFWSAAAATAALAKGALVEGQEAENAPNIVSQAFAAAQAALSTSATFESTGEVATAYPVSSSSRTGAAAEAALRVRIAAAVGLYWCSFLEEELSRFDHILHSCLPRNFSFCLLKEILSSQQHQQERTQEYLLMIQEQQQQMMSSCGRMVRKESANFRRAAAFLCSLAAALLLELACQPDPEQIFLDWHKLQSQKCQQVQLQQDTGGLSSTEESKRFLQFLIHGRGRDRGANCFMGPLGRFLVTYVDMRLLDLMEDSAAFGTAVDAPEYWAALPQELQLHLQKTSSACTNSPYSCVVRVADFRRLGSFSSVRLQEQDGRTLKRLQARRQEHAEQHCQQNHLDRPVLRRQQVTVCLVTHPLALRASQYQEIQKLCRDRGCSLVLRHRSCVSACCCRCHESRCSAFCCQNSGVSTRGTAFDYQFASLIILLGLDQDGYAISLQRLRQLLKRRQQHLGHEQDIEWDGIALVGQKGNIEGLRGFAMQSETSTCANASRFLVADTVVGRAIQEASSDAAAESILALASNCCTRGVPEASFDFFRTLQAGSASRQVQAGEKGGHVTLITFPTRKVVHNSDGCICYSEDVRWQGFIQEVSAAIQSALQTGAQGPPAASSQEAAWGSSKVAVSSFEPQNTVPAFMSTWKELAAPPSQSLSPVSVVALLPVGLPGSGKTTVLLEALRPALRQELVSQNTFPVGGVTGFTLWEGRPSLETEATTTLTTAETSNTTETERATKVPAVSVSTAKVEATATTAEKPAQLVSAVDCACILSSDEFTGEVLRSFGYRAPVGSLYQMCHEEALKAGPAAISRLSVPCGQQLIGGDSQSPPNEKAIKAAIAEARRNMKSALDEFFTQLTEALVHQMYKQRQEQEKGREDSAAGRWSRPIRVLIALDRNHPPNAIEPRFHEMQEYLHALQSTVLERCGILVRVATAALLLPPDVAQEKSSGPLRTPVGCSKKQRIPWDFPWSVEVVLRCMHRVLTRVDHATLSGRKGQRARLSESPAADVSESDVTQDNKALHICLSFLSCFRGYSNLDRFLESHPCIDHVLQLQTVLPKQQQQQEQSQLPRQQLQTQQQLLLTALSSLRPFSELPANQDIYSALAASLRQFPPNDSGSGFFQPSPQASATSCAAELLHLLENVYSSMDNPVLQQPSQRNQQPREQQPQQPQEVQQQGVHRDISPTSQLEQPQRDLDGVMPEDGPVVPFTATSNCGSDIIMRLPTFFSVLLNDERTTLASLTEQLFAAAKTAESPCGPSVEDISKAIMPVEKPHVTTFYLGGGSLKVSRDVVAAANDWLDKRLSACCAGDASHSDSVGKFSQGSLPVSSNFLRLQELLASRRQVGLYFKFRVTHLVLTDFGLACGALSPVCPVLPLAECSTLSTSPLKVFSQDNAPNMEVECRGVEGEMGEIDGRADACGHFCAACGPHECVGTSSKVYKLCMAANHYAHVTLCLSEGVAAVMSNDVLQAADKAIVNGIREGRLRAGTPRPYCTGAPENVPGTPENHGEILSLGAPYQSVECSAVGDSDDPQELIVFTGAVVRGISARLWVWVIPEDSQEELEGPLQAS